MDNLCALIALIIVVGSLAAVARLLYRRRRARKAVMRLAHDMGADVRECFVSGRSGLERLEADFNFRGYSVRIGAGSAVSIDMQGFESSAAFALGAPYFISMMNQRRESPPLLAKLSLFVNPDIPSSALEWLAVEDNARTVAALECSRREPLYVGMGQIIAVIQADRATENTLSTMADLAKRLESSPPQPVSGRVVDGLRLDPDRLPEDLRVLIPLIEGWAVGDDAKRERLLQAASPEERERLIGAVSPLMDRINAYLDSFDQEEVVPEEAVLIGRLAEAIAELGV